MGSRRESLSDVKATWEYWGKSDPLGAILSRSGDDDRWDLQQFMETGEAEISALFLRLEQLGIAPSTDRALDFGCGVGRLSQAMAPRFEAVEGIDISESMLDHARRLNRFEDRCVYRLNAQPDLKLYPDGSFTFIYSNITLQHIPPHLGMVYIAEFIRLLGNGGLAVFQLPSHFRSPVLRAHRWMRTRSPALHTLYRALWHGGEPPPVPPYPMYWIPTRRVQAHISASGGEVVARDREHSAPPEWLSFRYYVRKVA